MANANIGIVGTITGGPAGDQRVSVAIQNASAPEQSLSLIMAAGDNVVTIPAGAVGCIIVPPAGATTTKALGTGGQFPISASRPQLLTFGSQATFIINSSGLDTAATEILFF